MNAMLHLARVRKPLPLLALTLILCLASSGCVQAEVNTYQQIAKSAVYIRVPKGMGSGVVVDRAKGLIVTAAHVVADKFPGNEAEIYFPLLNDHKEVITQFAEYGRQAKPVRAKVIYYNKTRDVAVLQVAKVPASATAISLSKKGGKIGERVGLVGNSDIDQGGLFSFRAGDTINRLTDPAGTRRLIISIPTNPGDSGGPIFNMNGELVAIVSRGTTGYSDAQAARVVFDILQRFVQNNQVPKVPPAGLTEQVRDRAVDIDEVTDALTFVAQEKQVIHGELTANDGLMNRGGKQCYFKRIGLKVAAGKTILDLESEAFDAFMRVKEAKGKLDLENDDRGDGTRHSRIEINVAQVMEVEVTVTTYGEKQTGPFMLIMR